MKFLVISDNHGDRDILSAIYKANAKNVTAIFHCGDSELSVSDPLFQNQYVVQGNNDYGQNFPVEVTVPFESETVYMTHGDHYQVNFGLTQLSLRGKEAGASLVFFGHTHQLMADYVDQTLYLNPGSISLPRGEFRFLGGTYAIVDVDRQTIDVQFYTRDQEPVPELHQKFLR